ncbi:MAG: STT3 domain-containing protein, partial [Planctomycetota bacterium]
MFLLLACFGLCRTVPALGQVFRGSGEVRLLGGDSYYHLRHARCAVQEFPRLQRWDHATHYPHGERAKTPGLFDLTLAAAALPAPDALPGVAAWAPVVLGLAAFAVLFLLVRFLAGRAAALLALFFLLLYPGGFLGRSTLGFADHHAAEVLLALLSLLGLVRCLGDRTTARWWRPAVAAALPLALFQFTWVGAPIYLLLLAAALFLLAVARLLRTGSVGNAPRVCTRFGLGLLLLLAPTGLLLPDLVMDRQLFPLILAAAAGLVAVLAPLLLASQACAARGGRPRLVALGLLVLGAVGVWLLARMPGGEGLLDQLVRAKTPLVAEHRAVSWGSFAASHGLPGFLALLAPVAALWTLPRRGDEGRTFLAVAVGTMVLALWWGTHDYGYAAGVFLALLAAVALSAGVRSLPAGRWPRATAGAVLTLAVVLPLWPLRWARTPWLTPATVERITHLDDAWVAALRWTEQNTPPPTLPVDAPVEPWGLGDFSYPEGTYGIWCAWDYGNFVAAIGRRHVVWSQGADAQVARWLVLTNERESLEHLDRGCKGSERVRYVIVDAKTMGDRYLTHARLAGRSTDDYRAAAGRLKLSERHAIPLYSFGEPYSRSIAARLYMENGTGLAHYRLVFASRQRSFLAYVARILKKGGRVGAAIRRQALPIRSLEERLHYERILARGGIVRVPGLGYVFQGAITARVKVFERVRGARIAGRT